MPFAPTTLREIFEHGFDDVIDVRSPGEFAEDHIPGALSLPVLDDDERARVGTMYVQESPFLARKTGAALVSRNAARHLEDTLIDRDGGWRPLVHCWRGGQRSGSFASILREIGWRVEVLEGGYRRYRRLVVEALYDRDWPGEVVLIDGNTGTAKTDLLPLLAARGVQVLDLEGLANHRGSLLGHRGAQPGQKSFETALAQGLSRLDPSRPLVVEAESSKIGDCLVPPALWSAMRQAPRIEVAAPLAARADYLARAYADLVADPGALAGALDGLIPFHGRARVAEWKAMAGAGETVALAEALAREHYDPRYAASRSRSEGRVIGLAETDALDEAGIARLADRVAALAGAG